MLVIEGDGGGFEERRKREKESQMWYIEPSEVRVRTSGSGSPKVLNLDPN